MQESRKTKIEKTKDRTGQKWMRELMTEQNNDETIKNEQTNDWAKKKKKEWGIQTKHRQNNKKTEQKQIKKQKKHNN